MDSSIWSIRQGFHVEAVGRLCASVGLCVNAATSIRRWDANSSEQFKATSPDLILNGGLYRERYQNGLKLKSRLIHAAKREDAWTYEAIPFVAVAAFLSLTIMWSSTRQFLDFLPSQHATCPWNCFSRWPSSAQSCFKRGNGHSAGSHAAENL